MVGFGSEIVSVIDTPPFIEYSILAPVMGLNPSNPFLQDIWMLCSSMVPDVRSETGAGGTVCMCQRNQHLEHSCYISIIILSNKQAKNKQTNKQTNNKQTYKQTN